MASGSKRLRPNQGGLFCQQSKQLLQRTGQQVLFLKQQNGVFKDRGQQVLGLQDPGDGGEGGLLALRVLPRACAQKQKTGGGEDCPAVLGRREGVPPPQKVLRLPAEGGAGLPALGEQGGQAQHQIEGAQGQEAAQNLAVQPAEEEQRPLDQAQRPQKSPPVPPQGEGAHRIGLQPHQQEDPEIVRGHEAGQKQEQAQAPVQKAQYGPAQAVLSPLGRMRRGAELVRHRPEAGQTAAGVQLHPLGQNPLDLGQQGPVQGGDLKGKGSLHGRFLR